MSTIRITLICLTVILTSLHLSAEERKPSTAELFQEAYELLILADEAKDSRKLNEAAALYRDASSRYLELSRKYPHMETEVVKFRLTYCETQLKTINKAINGVMTAEENKASPTPITPDTPTPDTAVPPTNQVDVTPMLTQARASLNKGDTESAMKVLIEALREDAGNTTTRLLIGTAQCRAGRFEDAIKMMTPLIEDQPKNPQLYIVIATAQFGLGRMEDAATALRHAIKIDDTIADAHYDMVQVVIATTPFDITEARKHYKRYIELGGPKDPKLDYLLK